MALPRSKYVQEGQEGAKHELKPYFIRVRKGYLTAMIQLFVVRPNAVNLSKMTPREADFELWNV
jgi:hypothetical protein